ncbi:hypothetical protein FOMPIDRAFT_1025130 [Fomitopsis schrenkii]|uniref:Uncharacterized protein n=1 Tax=Fomitopsis schrenkii TaxID=2126942 RepID=S8DX77_FOMSC|nr:hypothetical protein FOMPIDRAFT_1025130 [Fomitopsis schrenkii]
MRIIRLRTSTARVFLSVRVGYEGQLWLSEASVSCLSLPGSMQGDASYVEEVKHQCGAIVRC